MRSRLETLEMSSVVGCGETTKCVPGPNRMVVLEEKVVVPF